MLRQESGKGCADTMGIERYAGREPRSDAVCVAYGLTTKGNGEVILSWEKHMSLSIGGGQAGQGYPAVFVLGVDLYNQCLTGGVSKTLNNRATDADHVPCVLVLNDQGGA